MGMIRINGRHAAGCPPFKADESSASIDDETLNLRIRIGQSDTPDFWIEVAVEAVLVVIWADHIKKRAVEIAEQEIYEG